MCRTIIAIVHPQIEKREVSNFQKNYREKILELVNVTEKPVIKFFSENSPFNSRKIFGGDKVKTIIFTTPKANENIRQKILENHQVGEFHTMDSFKESIEKLQN